MRRGWYTEAIMLFFEHAGLRPLWPVIFFLPWFFVGVAYLVKAMRHGEKGVGR